MDEGLYCRSRDSEQTQSAIIDYLVLWGAECKAVKMRVFTALHSAPHRVRRISTNKFKGCKVQLLQNPMHFKTETYLHYLATYCTINTKSPTFSYS